MTTTIPAENASIIISDRTAGQIVQRGAMIHLGRVYRVTRDQSVGSLWTLGKRLSSRKATVQLCYELANS